MILHRAPEKYEYLCKSFKKWLLTPRSMILRGAPEKYKYLGENKTKNEHILTHLSVAQTGSNNENNWRLKISLDCPFKL